MRLTKQKRKKRKNGEIIHKKEIILGKGNKGKINM